MQRAQRQDLELWATLTIQIARNLRAPARQKEHLYQGLMILLNPELYQDGSNVRKLITSLRSKIQHAVQQATRTTQRTQANSPTSTTPVPPTSSKCPNALIHAVTSQTMTSTPTPRNDKFTADISISNPLPLPKIISPATITNPCKVDDRTEQDSNTTNDIIYEQDMRWALKESRVSLEREQIYTPDNRNHNLGASSSTYEAASASARSNT